MELQKMTRIYLKTIALLSVFILINGAPAPKTKANPTPYQRLPGGIEPTHYDLTIAPNIGAINEGTPSSFAGNIVIKMTVTDDNLDQIVLNGKDLIIDSATVKDVTATPPGAEITLDANPGTADADQIILTGTGTELKDILKKGNELELKIAYKGQNNDDMRGFYRSSYFNEAGTKRWLLTTQFESSDARRAFPCFDEPHLKAIYKLTVLLPKADYDNGYRVLFNTPLAKPESEDKGLVTFEFQETPKKISSYLIAFIISDFKPTDAAIFKSDFDGNDIEKPFTTWGQSKFIDGQQGQVSQDAGVGAINVLTRKLDVGFGFPKIDQVGIPDFSAGAMENWGLTTYRERMLFFPENGSVSLKQSDVTVTTHELTHQWFGDLVTLKWWSDVWLNEGFATFFEYHASNEIDNGAIDATTWNLIGQFLVNELQSGAFEADALRNSRPLHSDAFSKPSEIDTLFDSISYSKGGSVIRMMAHAMGETRFYAALKEYLKTNAEGNADYTTLLASFDKELKPEETVTFTERFSTWITEPGYPVVHVGNMQNGTYTITQKRFFLQKVQEAKDEEASKWHIPITYSTDLELQFDETGPTVWLPKDGTSVIFTTQQLNESWIVLNNQETGYYRVNYDQELWDALKNVLNDEENFETIHEFNRAQIIDDAFTLARSTDSEYLEYTTPLEIALYLKNEKSYVPWKSAINAFSFLNTKLAKPENPEDNLIHDLVREVIDPVYTALSLTVHDTDSHLDRLQRIQIASLACKVGLSACEDEAKKLFEDELNDKKVNSDVRGTVLCTGIRTSDDKAWNKLWEKYPLAPDNVEQTLLISALGCTKDKDLLNTFLALTLQDNSPIRSQDFSSVFSSVYNGNPENVQVALDFLENNLVSIATKYGGLNPLGGLLTGIAGKLNDQEQIDQLTKLKKTIEVSTEPKVNAAKENAESALNIATSNQEWVQDKSGPINDWLKKRFVKGTGGASASVPFSMLTVTACFAVLLFK